MKRRLFLLMLLLLSVVVSRAATEIDGIYYNLDSSSKTATVMPGTNKYTGSVTIPKTVNYSGVDFSVKSIGSYAFYYCSGLTSVTIPNSVTSIDNYAFAYCYGLTTLSIPNSVTSIGSYAFYYCSGLTSVTIPNSVTSIGSYAFCGCYGMTTFSIPNSVTSIGDHAFASCTGLITLSIPNSVTSIGNDAFSYCSGLTSITIPSSIKTIGSYTTYGCDALTDIYCLAEELPEAHLSAFDKTVWNIILHIPASVLSVYQSTEPWSKFKEVVAIEEEKTYDWSVGAGGDFASINAAMSDSRVKDGDVLQVLRGTKFSAAQNVTKAVTIQGNGYKSTDDGYCSILYIDQENVTVKSLYTDYIYIKYDKATIERCRIDVVSVVSDYGPEDITIRGCQIIGHISGDESYYLSGWKIYNNIIACNLMTSATYMDYHTRPHGTICYLDGAIIDHNIIVLIDKPIVYLTRAAFNPFLLTSPSFTNNIIIEKPWSSDQFTGDILGLMAAEATKFEYNIHSDTSNPGNWSTNKPGYGDSDDVLFVCTGFTYDTYYQLAENSPAKGYANDGGDCGPWSGSFPYIQYGIDTTNPGGGDDPSQDEWQVEPNDLLALKNIHQAFGGDGWTTKKWSFANNGHKAEDFPGVTFDDNGRVTAINLENNGLAGECFTVSSPQLSELTTLNLSRNKITGDLGKLVSQLAKLTKLDVSYNRLMKTDGVMAFAEGTTSTINVQYQNRVYQSSSPTAAAFTDNVLTMEAPVVTIGQTMEIDVPSLYTYNYKGQTHNINAPLKVRQTSSPSSNIGQLTYNGTSNYTNGSTYKFNFSNVLYIFPQDQRVVLVDEWNGYTRYSAFPVTLRYVEGDADMTGATNVLDVQYTLNFILAPLTQSYFNWSAANTYTDATINVQDIVQTVNIILGLPRTPNYGSRAESVGDDDSAWDGYVYAQQGRIVLTATKPVAAIDIDLEGVSTDEVALALNRRDFQMIGRNTEWGSRYMIFSPTGKSIPAGTEANLLRMSGAGQPVSVECSDPQAQEVAIAIGSAPTGIAEATAPDAGDEGFYSLSGQRVENPRKDIYVQHGRKIVVKK